MTRTVASTPIARLVSAFLFVGGGIQVAVSAPPDTAAWPGFRGARGDGISQESGVFDPAGVTLEIKWKKPLGSGYSGVSIADGRAVTTFSDGKSDVVIAFDSSDGRELWRYALDDTYRGHDGSQDGPLSTPLIADGRVFAIAPRGKFVALDAATGREIWKTDLVADHQAVKPHYGFTTSPIFVNGAVIVEVGAKDALVGAFDPQTGARRWAVGNDKVNYQSPVLCSSEGRPLILAAGDEKLVAIDPAKGELAWEHAHGGSGERGATCLVPVPIGPDRVFLKHQDDRSVLLSLAKRDGRTVLDQVWEAPSIGKTYGAAVYHAGSLFGYSGRTLTCVDAKTGTVAWRSREPGDGFPIITDNHLIVATMEGGVHVIKAAADRFQGAASVKVFDDLCWAPPSFSNRCVFVRSLSEIACIAVRPGAAGGVATIDSAAELAGTRFGKFLDTLQGAENKPAAIDKFVASNEFPLVEPDGKVVFVYRGPGEDVVLGGDLTGFGTKRRLERVKGTDLFYCAARIEPDARIGYAFVRDYKVIFDPLNPRKAAASGYDEDLEMTFRGGDRELSWFGMPQWKPPTHLDSPEEDRRGRIESAKFKSEALGAEVALDVYIPANYEKGTDPLPVVYVHDGRMAREQLRLVNTLDNLISRRRITPVVAVFINHQPPFFSDATAYAKMAALELPAFVDAKYRTVRSRDGRAHVASGMAGYAVLYTVLAHADSAGRVGVQSPFMADLKPIEPVMKSAAQAPLTVYLDWGKYDIRSPLEGWSLVRVGGDLDRYLRAQGYAPKGGEAHDGSGVASWQNRTDDMLEALFPPAK